MDSWNNVSECLYVTKNGSFFLCGYGESNTRWAVKFGQYKDKRGTLTSDIQAITEKEALAWCEKNSDLTLGIGLGMADQEDEKIHNYFRIGHMGHINATMVLGVISTIDVALKALNIPHGQNALDAASKKLSESYSV